MALCVNPPNTNQCLAFQENPIELFLSQTLNANISSSPSVKSPLRSWNLRAGDLGAIWPSPSAGFNNVRYNVRLRLLCFIPP